MSYVYKLSEEVAPSLHKVFEDRGWVQWNGNIHEEDEWNILWSTKRYCKLSSSFLLDTFQKLNHFNGTSQITKKDYLTRNLKRMRANFGKIYSFYPKSYQFPLQYSEFVAMTQRKNKLNTDFMLKKQRKCLHTNKYKHNPYNKQQKLLSAYASCSRGKNKTRDDTDSIWIAKPACGRRGENITLFTDVSKLNYTQPMIVQKYISNPLLIGGYKFDLRIYVLVTSIRPLQIHCYHDGLCRFSTQQYDLKNLDNVYSHLTNSSINKTSDTFNTNKLVIGEGCKWTINKLIKHLQKQIDDEYNMEMMTNINDTQSEKKIKKVNVGKKLWNRIHDMIILTLLPIVMDVEQSQHCFELFGFDVLIDEKYNCWLLEVNGSPAIAINSDVDQVVKYPMLNDLVDCIQNEVGFMVPTKNKYRSKKRCSFRRKTGEEDSLSKRLNAMELNHCREEEEAKSVETVDSSKERNPFQNNVGGFEHIFPFNANTFESNEILTNIATNRISRAQQFKKIVVKEIRKRRQKQKV